MSVCQHGNSLYGDCIECAKGNPPSEAFKQFREAFDRHGSAIGLDPRSSGVQEEIARLQKEIAAQQESARVSLGDDIKRFVGTQTIPDSTAVAYLEAARAEYEKHGNALADLCKANSLERENILNLARLTHGGCKWLDIIVRKDGKEHRFEGDWLYRLFVREARR